MITKDKVLDLISEEKEKQNSYLQLCAHYKVSPDPLILAKHSSKMEILELIIKM